MVRGDLTDDLKRWAYDTEIILGEGAEVGEDAESSIAIGDGAEVGDGSDSSVLIGPDAEAEPNCKNTVAIGNAPIANDESNNSIIIGNFVTSWADDTIVIGTDGEVAMNEGEGVIGVDQLRFGAVEDTIPDEDLGDSEITFEIDEADDQLVVRMKDSDGNLETASIDFDA